MRLRGRGVLVLFAAAVFTGAIGVTRPAHADEGMWLLNAAARRAAEVETRLHP